MAASRSPRLRLLHMRDEIESLSKELAGLNLDIYRKSYALRRITERAIQIVSEASRALPEDLRARHRDVPWADIIAIGNPLRHEYPRIDDRVLWETARVDLPKLQPIIVRMLSEIES